MLLVLPNNRSISSSQCLLYLYRRSLLSCERTCIIGSDPLAVCKDQEWLLSFTSSIYLTTCLPLSPFCFLCSGIPQYPLVKRLAYLALHFRTHPAHFPFYPFAP